MMRRVALWMAKNVLGCRHARMAGFLRCGDNGVQVFAVGDLLLSEGALVALGSAHDKDARVPGARWALETVESAYFIEGYELDRGGLREK